MALAPDPQIRPLRIELDGRLEPRRELGPRERQGLQQFDLEPVEGELPAFQRRELELIPLEEKILVKRMELLPSRPRAVTVGGTPSPSSGSLTSTLTVIA